MKNFLMISTVLLTVLGANLRSAQALRNDRDPNPMQRHRYERNAR